MAVVKSLKDLMPEHSIRELETQRLKFLLRAKKQVQ